MISYFCFLKKHILQIIANYIFQRVFAAVLVMLSSLLASWLLEASIYGKIAFVVFYGKFLLIGNFGAISGFLFKKYREEDITLQVSESDFSFLYMLHFFIFIVVLFFIFRFLNNIHLLGLLCFSLLLPLYLIEPVTRVHRCFFVSLLPELLMACSVLFSLVWLRFFSYDKPLVFNSFIKVFFSFLFLSSLASWAFFLYFFKLIKQSPETSCLKGYVDILRKGFPLYVGGGIFLLILYADRFYLESYHSERDLGVYMLAFQLSTGSSLILTALNFIGTVNYGEMIRDGGAVISHMFSRLKIAILLSFVGCLIVSILSWFLEFFVLVGFKNLFINSVSLVLGFSFFYVSGSVTPMIFYLGRQKRLNVALFVVLVCVILNNQMILKIDGNPIFIPVFTGVFFTVYGLWAIFYTIYISRSLLSTVIVDRSKEGLL